MVQFTKKKLSNLLILFCLESFITAILTFLNKSESANAFFLGLTLTGWGLVLIQFLASLVFLCCGIWVWKDDKIFKKAEQIITGKWLEPGLLIFLIMVSGFLVYKQYSWEAILRLAPLLASSWLIGLQSTFCFSIFKRTQSLIKPVQSTVKGAVLALVSSLLIIASCLIPSGVPALFNGVPVNTHVEFIFLAILLPFALVINWRSFAKRWVVIAAFSIFIIKLLMTLCLPAYGIQVDAYKTRTEMASGTMERSYESLVVSPHTQIMHEPYNNFREFPFEWYNHEFVQPPSDNWIGLHISTYGTLNEGDRLAFFVNNLVSYNVEMTDLETGEKVPIILLDENQPVDVKPILNTPAPSQFYLNGDMTFAGERVHQFKPILIKTDGSINDPFSEGVFWTSIDGAMLNPTAYSFFRFVAWLVDIALLFLGLYGLLAGMITLSKNGIIQAFDIYLAASSIGLFTFSRFIPHADFGYGVHWIIFTFLLLKITQIILVKTASHSSLAFFLIVFPNIISIFLCYDFDYLRQVELLPFTEDGFSYQLFSSIIYLKGDIFLFNNIPPRGYKVLLPYLIGLLHVAFGQACIAQFHLGVWCASLTAKKILDILHRLAVKPLFYYPAGTLFMFVLTGPLFFTFYFRFGMIEPPAVLCLILLIEQVLNQRIFWVFVTGVLTTLFRMDYLGAAVGALFMATGPITGKISDIWLSIFKFIKSKWLTFVAFGFSLVIIPISIIAAYFLTQPNYMLNADDTYYGSLLDILMGLLKLASGGTWLYYSIWFKSVPFYAVLLALVLYAGILAGIIPLFFRQGRLKNVDVRLGVLIVCCFSIYVYVSPTNYAPRFSTFLLPIVCMSLFYTLYQLFRPEDPKPEELSQPCE